MGIQSKTYKQFLGILDKHGFSESNKIERYVTEITVSDVRDRKFTEFCVTVRVEWYNKDTDKSLKMVSDLKNNVCEREGIAFVECGVNSDYVYVDLRFISHASID